MNQAIKFLGIGTIVFLLVQNVGKSILNKLSLGRIRLKNFSFTAYGFSFKLLVEVKNDSAVSLPLDGFVGHINYGDEVLANVTYNTPVSISANSKVELPFDIQTTFAQLGDNISLIIQSGQLVNNMWLNGEIISNGISIPVSKQIIEA